MKKRKSVMELEYELEFTKRILQKIMELNEGKDLTMPDASEMDKIESELKQEMETEYPKYRIQKKK
nr:hypothetical protein [Allomuricauda sp.]